MQFDDVRRLTFPATSPCNKHVDDERLSTASALQDYSSCRDQASAPATFNAAFGEAIRTRLAPWSTTLMTM